MISLLLPYWDRQAAANKALSTLAESYSGLQIEVIVIDDGNPVPFVAPQSFPLKLRVIRMPTKNEPRPPAAAWNAGARAASGDLLALSCIEVQHPHPVLWEMAAQLQEIGRDGYVLASAWCPEQRAWHCGGGAQIWDHFPVGVGGSFLSMMHRTLFERIGGFDEDYMDGAGYEDRDFVRRLQCAGAQIVVRDDMVVHHPKRGANIKWPPEGFSRNEQLYRSKWGN
jgi:hypothetical protein